MQRFTFFRPEAEKKIEEKLNESLKNKDKTVFPTLRLIISAIKDFKIESKVRDQDLKDQATISILKKMTKQRNDSCEAYKKAGREDLLKKEFNRLKIEESRVKIVHTDSVVSDEETPLTAIKNSKNTSMWKCINSQREGVSDISLSAGNTGVLLAVHS